MPNGMRCSNAWRAAAAGRPRLLLIRGEAGIGKTRLAEELVDWCGLSGITAADGACYAGEGRLAYAPIAAWLKSDALQPALMTLDASWLTDVAQASSRAARGAPRRAGARTGSSKAGSGCASSRRWRRRSGRRLRSSSSSTTCNGPTPTRSNGFTTSCARRRIRRCLVVATVRAEEEQDNPPLGRLLGQLEHDDLLTVDRARPARSGRHGAAGRRSRRASARRGRRWRARSAKPKAIRCSSSNAGAWSWRRRRPPRADARCRGCSRLSPRGWRCSRRTRARVAEVAAAIGRDFRFDILAQASDLEEDALVRALDELWRRHIVRVQADERWDFSHDRIREVAYGGIGPARAPPDPSPHRAGDRAAVRRIGSTT